MVEGGICWQQYILHVGEGYRFFKKKTSYPGSDVKIPLDKIKEEIDDILMAEATDNQPHEEPVISVENQLNEDVQVPAEMVIND